MVQKPRRDFDRKTWRQVNAFPIAYNLLWAMPQGKIELMPTPNTTSTAHLRYYARMTVPSAVTLQPKMPYGSWISVGTDLYHNGTTDNLAYPLYEVQVVSASGVAVGNYWTCSDTVKDSGGVATGLTLFGTVYALTNTTITLLLSEASLAVLDAYFAGGGGNPWGGTIIVGGDDQFLDIPETYTDGILKLAKKEFLEGIGASPDRIRIFQLEADAALALAQGAENEAEDDDICFEEPTYSPDIRVNYWNTIV